MKKYLHQCYIENQPSEKSMAEMRNEETINENGEA